MIIKTHGIVLRLDPFSRTSQVITWLTPDHGRTVTLAKGAKRTKNNLVGQYDCFYTCELLFYFNRRSSIHILKECSPLHTREPLRFDWRASMTASYLCDLLNRLSPPESACRKLYAWAGDSLNFLAQHGTTATVLNWSELKLLGLLGFAPQLSKCLDCGTTTFPPHRPVRFSISRGGLVCTQCHKHEDNMTLQLPHDVLAMMRGWEGAETPLMAKRTVCTAKQAECADRLLSSFIHYHLQANRSRDIVTGLT